MAWTSQHSLNLILLLTGSQCSWIRVGVTCCCGADAVRCSNRTTKFRTLFDDLMFVRVNPYLIPERYFLHVRRLLAEPTVIPEVTVDWCAPPS